MISHTFSVERTKGTRFHSLLRKENLHELNANRLSNTESVTLSVSRLPDSRFHVFQSDYKKAVIAEFPVQTSESLIKRNSSLPGDFRKRILSKEDEKPFSAEQKSVFLIWIQTLAWLTRTRPDISSAVAYKQTYCANPRNIDLDDLEFIVGYLAEFPLLGVFIISKVGISPYGSMRLGLLILIGSLTPDALLPWGSRKS